MTVVELRARVDEILGHVAADDHATFSRRVFLDVLRAIAAEPTRSDAHALAAEALRLVIE